MKIEFEHIISSTFLGIVFVVITLLTWGCASSQSSAEHTAKTKKAVMEALANKQLRINVRLMHPVRYASRTVSYGFYLEIKGDKLESCLPYMGQVYQAATFSSENLNFEATIIRYHETRPKKGLARIELAVRTKEDIYHYQLDIYDSGTAYIRVRGLNRDSICFDGDCEV